MSKQQNFTTSEKVRAVYGLLRDALPAWENMSEPDKLFINDRTVERYLFAFKGKPEKAAVRIVETMKWRNEYKGGIDKFTWDKVQSFCQSGSKYLRGRDLGGHAIIIQRPRSEEVLEKNTGMSLMDNMLGQIDLMYYLIEQALVEMHRKNTGVDKITILLDFGGWKLSRQGPMSLSKQVLGVLQNHYPETAFKFVLVDCPSWWNVTYKLMRPFIDPVTREKIVMVTAKDPIKKREALKKHIHPSEIERAMGGDYDEQYVHATAEKLNRELDDLRLQHKFHPFHPPHLAKDNGRQGLGYGAGKDTKAVPDAKSTGGPFSDAGHNEDHEPKCVGCLASIIPARR